MTRGLSRFAIVVSLLSACLAHADALSELASAHEAAKRGQFKPLEAWRQRHAGHALEAYPAFWILSGSAERADPAQVRAFLERYPDTPLAETLRREWLKVLGASGNWETFRAEHPKLAVDDSEIACFAFQDRLARGDPEVANEARLVFVSGRESPAACEPVFATLAGSGKLSEAEIWARIRKLLAANNVREARRTHSLLAPRNRFDEKLLERAGADPSGYLGHEKSPILTRIARKLAIYALARLARGKPEEAAERLTQIAARLGTEAARYTWGQVAYHAAQSHHPRALEWYGKAGDTPLSDAQIAWKARAALRAGAWKEVLASIQQLSPEEARESAWRYWRARALRALGESEASQGLLRSLAGERNFYGILAAEDLGVATPPQWNGWKPQPADIERVRATPGLQRALALYRMDYDAEAVREWIWAIRGMDDRDLLAAAELGGQAGEPDRAINTANRTVQLHDYAQRYPIPHREAVAAAVRQWGLDEALMYSIIRQESRFMPEAKSRVGAMGLMQLMPATASWVARQIPVQSFRSEMLVQPAVNVRMGTYYFGRVLGDLGHPVLATAAYNAGPGRARRWRDERPLEGAIYAETIPFNETRDYVKQVFANAWFYRHRLTGEVPSLKQLVGTVPGRNGESADAALASSIP